MPASWGRSSRVWCVLAALGLAACGAADERVDPTDLALRDLLGVAPRVAADWDAAQRLAARQVLADGLGAHDPEPMANPAPLLDDALVVGALAAVDDRLLERDRDALGLVVVEHPEAVALGRPIDAPRATDALLGDAVPAPTLTLELDPQAWPCATAPACDLGVLAALAADAAPGASRVRVLPVVQLAVIAALVTDVDGVPTLLVNPIVTAVGEPEVAAAAAGGGGAGFAPRVVAPPRPRVHVLPLVTATWVYDSSIQACATAIKRDCVTCLAGGVCDEIWAGVSGMAACSTLDAQPDQNYALVCVNLAVSLGDVGACLQRTAPSCAFDTSAILTPAQLRANVNFVDNATCRDALDACLVDLYGATDSSSGCDCGGCDCGGCDCGSNTDNGSCSSTDSNTNDCNNNSCSNGSCNDGSCGGGGNSCGGGGSGGSCSVARAPSRGPGLATGVVWVLLPIPAALFARRRARRDHRLIVADPPDEPAAPAPTDADAGAEPGPAAPPADPA